MALKTIFLLITVIFLWLVVSCSEVDHSGAQNQHVNKGMKQIKGELPMVGKKDGIIHGNFGRNMKEFSVKYKAKVDDLKATAPGHSPGIGHTG